MFSSFERMVAYRYLRSPRQEGFISVIAGFSFLGIMLGVATLIIVMSVMNGFRHELLKQIVGLNGHIGIHASVGGLAEYESVLPEIKKTPSVQSVYPIIDRQAMLMYHSQASGVMVHGVRPEDLKAREMISKNIKVGDLSLFGAAPDQMNTILIGSRLAMKMGVRVGDTISLLSPEGNTTPFGTMPRQKSFRILGIFEVGMSQYDSAVVFMPLPSAQSFFKLDKKVTTLEVFVEDPDKVSETSKILSHTLSDHVTIIDWKGSNNGLFQAVQIERNVMFLILSLVILIAAFNIISSLIMLVKDKTKDIAIMRTMGASRSTLMRIFFLTGASIGVVGTILGVSLGLAFALNIEVIRQWLQGLMGIELFNAEIYFLSQMPCRVDWNDVIWAVGMALGLSFLATIYPSWRAARLDPVEALRI